MKYFFSYFFFVLYLVLTECHYTVPNIFDENYFSQYADWGNNYNGFPYGGSDKVQIQLYYEVFCPHCRTFDTVQFRPVVEKLSPYLDIKTYPYGNAETYENNGQTVFKCQHGPTECYGNKLHACALDLIQNQTTALIYNTCMMEYSQSDRGSDDNAADRCGASMSIDSTPIKQCAKGNKGTELLKYYGVESKKANFKHVPYILINGVVNDGKNFMKDVCAAFSNPPSQCVNVF
ncbi:GILT-like protein 2 [Colias croceus]|uniref:GILT-like protein 2 n=1 Tax=Colias crocea TaxID=72248 RepID=UPI001E280684|nr:GILT-like protein 2 [Colias croceus]